MSHGCNSRARHFPVLGSRRWLTSPACVFPLTHKSLSINARSAPFDTAQDMREPQRERLRRYWIHE